MNPSSEFIEAVRTEMKRQGFKGTGGSTAQGKANSLISAYTFLAGSGVGIDEEALRRVSRKSEEAAKELDKLEGRLGEIQGIIDDTVFDVQFPDSLEGRILSLNREMMRDYHTAGVSPDVAARCTSYTLWAYLGQSKVPYEITEMEA